MSRPGSLTVRRVSGKADLGAFLELPWKVYEGDPAWIPPLLLDRRDFVAAKHPFYQHGSAALFLAERGGEVVGRVLASDDPRYNEAHGTNVACFGMFECLRDREAAHALLDAASAWAAERGRTALMGPIDYSTNYNCALLVEGFDRPPSVLMNHNPPWYAELLESWGLRKAKDLYGWWYPLDRDPPERWRRLAEKAARRSGITIRPMDKSRFDEEVAAVKALYNSAWENNWGFVKMTDAEFDHLAKDLKMLIVPELVLFAEAAGRPVGFSICLPNMNEALAKIDGRLTTWGLPIGLAKLLWHMRRIRTVRLVTLGVLEEYRAKAVPAQLILASIDAARRKGYVGGEMGWTLEDNDLINKPIQAVGGERIRTFRIYEKGLPSA